MLRIYLKYKRRFVWILAGIVWSVVAILNIGILVGMVSEEFGVFELILTPLYLFIIAASSVLTIFHFKITSIDYVRIDDDTLSLHRGIVIPRKKVRLTDIEKGTQIGASFIIQLKTGQEFDINLKNLGLRDINMVSSYFAHERYKLD
ncbi:hypothetical protein MUN88_05875 [Gracilibacillus caseinilyticus]|uniref:PH domain-containing protein n=1 Tax=Gracilibacillus caseinilyticus TaxID=2932256 RepID=A0ABY4F0H6_9BACI|nr:hypothetical protein [Gracilibacillus caseinilyticus]UOQ49608.1 hypothetical protein MUN88_05875 [Gracilibacillus caseinilyticus]